MKTWFTKEFSKQINVSVRTLHYYDKINLLNPSIRQENDYRLYSESDLLRLQKIIALKYFGFKLSKIKVLLDDNNNLLGQFSVQSQMLKEKVKVLEHASILLDELMENCKPSKSVKWKNLIKMIEVFQMTQQLEQSWMKDILNESELKQYAEFETKMKQSDKAEIKAKFEKRWQDLLSDIKASLDSDPFSEDGIKIGERFMLWTNEVYGKEYAHLRTKKFEQGFGEGKGLDAAGLTEKSFEWISQATNAYWRNRLITLLKKVGDISESEILCLWNEVMDDMYGNDNSRKSSLLDMAIIDKETPEKAKIWLKKLKSI